MLEKHQKINDQIVRDLLPLNSGKENPWILNKTLEKYEENPNWELYLWKQNDNFVGVIGVEINALTFTVHHVSVIPSFMNEGIGYKMVEQMQLIQDPRAMQSTEETMDFLAKCWENNLAVFSR